MRSILYNNAMTSKNAHNLAPLRHEHCRLGSHTRGVLPPVEMMRHLRSIPGMRESIVEGLRTPVARCAKELRW